MCSCKAGKAGVNFMLILQVRKMRHREEEPVPEVTRQINVRARMRNRVS